MLENTMLCLIGIGSEGRILQPVVPVSLFRTLSGCKSHHAMLVLLEGSDNSQIRSQRLQTLCSAPRNQNLGKIAR